MLSGHGSEAPAPDAMTEESSSDDDVHSDDEDIFTISASVGSQCEESYRSCFLYRWQQAIQEVSSNLRDNVLLPLETSVGEKKKVLHNVASGKALPAWHCAFKNCCGQACAAPVVRPHASHGCSHEEHLWQHCVACEWVVV